MTPNLLRNLTNAEFVHHLEQSNNPELQLAADRMHEMLTLERRLRQVEEELAEKTTELECSRAVMYDIESELVAIKHPDLAVEGADCD